MHSTSDAPFAAATTGRLNVQRRRQHAQPVRARIDLNVVDGLALVVLPGTQTVTVV